MIKDDLQKLISLLPNLIDLDIPYIPKLLASPGEPNYSPHSLLRLKSFATSPPSKESKPLNLDNLAQLALLPALKSLEVYDWGETEYQLSDLTLLGNIETLKIRGAAADIEVIKILIDACPSILHLELQSTFEGGLEFATRLPLLPVTLRSLSLHGDSISEAPIDSILPRLSQLQFLRLGHGCYGRTIYSALLQLPLLAHIHLGPGELDTAGFLSLITGSTRLSLLQTITLDFDTGIQGFKIARPSSADFSIVAELNRCKIELLDWTLPGAEDGDSFDQAGVQQVVEAAKEHGIKVEGSVFAALETLNSWGTELHNRSILYAFHLNDLAHLIRARSIAAEYGVTLPPLDLDSLDLDRLEIVENDVPEREWFMLSLGNKE